MSDSDDSDLEEGPNVQRHKTKIVYHAQFPYIHMEPPDIVYERWCKMKLKRKQDLGHLMHVSVFWWHILLRQQENHPTTAWAVKMGFLDSNVSNDLSLKRLEKMEILESILATMERGLSLRDVENKARAVVSLSQRFFQEEDCLTEAIRWLLDSGDPDLGQKLMDLGSVEVRYLTLSFVFMEYARYIQVVSCSKKKALMEMKFEPDSWSLSKSDEMKNKGNEHFQKKKYDVALKWYSKAIKYHPNNHILYGNRALCLLRSGKYLKALGDGKRAIVLQPDWAKGHYRFCDALFYLGEHQRALLANQQAQDACRADVEGQKDLLQQHERFQSELQEARDMKTKKPDPKKVSSKARSHTAGASSAAHLKTSAPPETPPEPQTKKSEKQKQQADTSGPSGARAHTDGGADRLRDVSSESSPRKAKKASSSTAEKPAVRSKLPAAADRASAPAEVVSAAAVRERFCAAVLEAHVALSDQRCHNAQQSFSVALAILESSSTTELGLTELDKSVLLYGYATALLETGQPEELAEAEKLFAKLESTERKFQSLVHYGMGRVYLKENRFAKARECFSNALLMIQRHITPGKLTWPTTKAIVEETQPAWLQEHLESLVEVCRFPPKADAVCRHQQCVSHSVQIYFSDPDFKGFIQLVCCQSCRIEFHMSCWRKLKTLSFADKNDKDFLKDSCFTPDCAGQICHILIFGSTGLIKCEFKSSIPKARAAGRSRLRQQCTSIKKLMSKNDRKLRRKQQRLAARSSHQEKREVMREEAAKEQPADRASPRDCIYMDRVLQQIHDNKALFKEEPVSISCFWEHLRPWLDLFESKGQESVLNSRRGVGVLSELVDLLLESRNRVWARVFIQTLGSTLHIKPRLQHWAQQLDDTGLKAAQSFIDRYRSHLEDLELKPLLSFPPLQESLVEKLGSVTELFDRDDFTVMEYLRQAPAKEMRLFIWTLESSRERYQSCHTILDQYFEDDAVCLVIKKTDDDEHMSSVFKSKNRHRKKKHKELKSVIVLSGMRAGHSRDEDDEDELFSEEDSLMFLNDMDPFSVPDHLRYQLAEFEENYSGSAQRSYYERMLDNHPDPTKETLYDYFAQVLEEHGPLCATDPLLVGELQNFPLEAQQQIADAGGLQAFLLQSLRFTMTERLIGLMKHAVCLSESSNTHSQILNPSASEFWPLSGEPPSSTGEPALLLPDPYTDEEDQLSAAEMTESDTEETRAEKHTAVRAQDFQDRTDVSVNTEPCAPFENNSGELMGLQKRRLYLLEELQRIRADGEAEQQRRQEELTELQEDTHNISQRMQIASTELSMFQQKLEEEVKKDQQEKKENQETLRSLKMEIKELVELQESLSRDISVRNRQYEAELELFLDVSNQCAAERLSLEDEIKRFRDACVKAERRSASAQLCVLQSRREHALRRLRMSVSEGKMVVKHLSDVALSSPSAALLSAIEDWKRHVSEAEGRIHATEEECEAQMQAVQQGSRLCSLPDISTPSVPSAPALPALQTPVSSAAPEESSSRRSAAPQHLSVYERIVERLHIMFPHYDRLVLNKFLQEVRSSCSGGVLSSLTYNEVINRVAQLILDHQENICQMNITAGDAADLSCPPSDCTLRAAGTPPLTHVWKNVPEKHRNSALVLNMEDPCIICHEDMSAEDLCVLECRHSFHRECIKSWLKEQSTCPTCREHALLPEDFPLLPGRQRRTHTAS